jgi:ABC-type transport system involved in cytochrome c biogenesis permease subunit
LNLGFVLAFRVTWLLYVAAFAMSWAWFRSGSEQAARVERWLLGLAIVLQFAGMTLFGLNRGAMPPVSPGETLGVLATATAAIYLFVELRSAERGIGIFATGLIAVFSVVSSVIGPAHEVAPILRDQFFGPHAASIIIAFSAFTMSAFMSVAYLLQYRQLRSRKPGLLFQRLPALQTLDRMTRLATRLGFLFLTLGLVLGAMLAQHAWGQAWSWDPKQCMTLLTWLLYGLAIGLRRLRDWQGGRIATVNLIAFSSVILGMALLATVFDTAHRFG